MPHDYTQTVRLLFEAFRKHDAERLAGLADPDIEWTSAENFIYADESHRTGVAAVRKLLFERIPADWDNFQMIPQEILGGGDIVIANGRFRGTFRANGASVDAQFVQVFQFKDGKVAKSQMYTDTAQFRDAVTAIRSASV